MSDHEKVVRDYEVVYIFDAALSKEDIDGKLETFHAKLAAEVTATDHWGVRQLAYPIQKNKAAYYVVVHASVDVENLPEFERLLKLDEQTLRYIIVMNEGQPSTGLSIVVDRPVSARRNDDDDDDGESRPFEPVAEADGEGSADGEEAERAPLTDTPPEFSGAGGRRRRHEGPAISLLNYKDVATLSRFITEQGKILPKRTTKVTAGFQRQLGTAVKRARYLALIPYVQDHES